MLECKVIVLAVLAIAVRVRMAGAANQHDRKGNPVKGAEDTRTEKSSFLPRSASTARSWLSELGSRRRYHPERN